MALSTARRTRARLACAAALLAVGGTLAALAGSADAAAATQQEPWRFAVFGDAPYGAWEMVHTRAVLQALAPDNAFVVHVGDLKSGRESCSDALLAARRDLLDASPRPLVFVFGDNEWTDCHRTAAGGFDPLERLAHLRTLFFARTTSLGRTTIALERQSDLVAGGLPEHVRWRHGTVLLATLNVAGSLDGLRAGAAARDEQRARRAAVLDWLASTYRHAAAEGLEAVVLLAHANIEFELEARLERPPRRSPDAYASLRGALRAQAQAFPGTTLFVHGETHRFRADRPFADARGAQGSTLEAAPGFAERFLRVEVSGWPDITSWVEVSVTPGRRQPFGILLRRVQSEHDDTAR